MPDAGPESLFAAHDREFKPAGLDTQRTLSGTFRDFHGLPGTLRDSQDLSVTHRDYHGLSETLRDSQAL